MRSALRNRLIASMAACAAFSASAQTSINLGNYQLTASHALDTVNERGLEASAVTYARDRGTLFFVGDEGLGVVEVSRTGTTIGSQAFNWAGTGSTHNDAEGLTYLGGGRLVVVDERPQRAYRFDYANGGVVNLADAPFATISSYTPNNSGIEGISFDARHSGSFVSVKQAGPQEVRSGGLSFAVGGGTPSPSVLFDASLLGLSSLSDVQVLSAVDGLAGSAAADNLLILSADSFRLVESTRSGTVLSSLDLRGITTQAIEGLTIDERGVIYLVAESSGANPSRLFVVSSPIPEPGTWALLLAGLGAVGTLTRRRRSAA